MKAGRFATAVLTLISFSALMLATYVAGYLLQGKVEIYDRVTERHYPQEWQKVVYKPAGTLESWLCKKDVRVWGPSDY
jgi:hypothetical protein